MTEWNLQGREFVNCNCDFGCPCQFQAPPTHGNCEMVAGYAFDAGAFGGVDLAGTRAAALYQWPGATHEGNGRMQIVVDPAAAPEQRAALVEILHGRETEPMATVWAVYAAMCPTQFAPLVRPVGLAIDVEGRTGRIAVEGVFETTGEPIPHRVTGKPHRARIELPHGFEYETAEMGSGSTRATGEIVLAFEKSYGQFARIHLSQSGVVRAG